MYGSLTEQKWNHFTHLVYDMLYAFVTKHEQLPESAHVDALHPFNNQTSQYMGFL